MENNKDLSPMDEKISNVNAVLDELTQAEATRSKVKEMEEESDKKFNLKKAVLDTLYKGSMKVLSAAAVLAMFSVKYYYSTKPLYGVLPELSPVMKVGEGSSASPSPRSSSEKDVELNKPNAYTNPTYNDGKIFNYDGYTIVIPDQVKDNDAEKKEFLAGLCERVDPPEQLAREDIEEQERETLEKYDKMCKTLQEEQTQENTMEK